ncbi:Oligoendopeptidase F [Lutibaculum baratangense AMV1]|uniref:Oligoendopeptidase F n=1 Tax=Lutibaculum baratangense AMV1 TaxID=631454 RepID=V4RAA9_9HYPH|nr:Oligoendopeptidase F [Lutibaculum baratangense AMV1]
MRSMSEATAAIQPRRTAPDLGALPEWNLDDLYPAMDSDEVKRDLARSLDESVAFEERWKGRLDGLLDTETGAAELAGAIREFEALQDLLGRLISYAGLQHALQVSDPARAKFYGDVQEKLTNAGLHLLFFPLELNRISDERIEAAMADPELAHYRPWIEDERKERPYQLEDRLEQLFHEKSVTGRGAWNRLFDETMAGLRFDVDGEELPLEPTLNLLQDPEEATRRKAAEAMVRTFREHLPTFALITNTLAKDKEISDRWRGFKDVADSRHLANRVEREVVDALVTSVREAYPRLSHRYYALKARWFGKDRLEFWDRNAPLPKAPQKTYRWEEARDTVLSAYAGFDPQMADIAKPFFEKGWIDAPTKPGKSPGAFAHPTVPSAHPYVLLNYQGRPRDVMTLAHELGHGVHQVLAAPQGPLMAPTPLTLAETASVFGEMLTFRAILSRAEPAERKALIAAKVEDMLNTVVRQIAFYVFERKLHEARRQEEVPAEEINRMWMEVQAESLGPAINLGDGYETFWAYVPHFIHSPFYVYAYAFGDCLVNSLYAIYQESEDGFAQRYFEMLKAGGSKHHSELLAPFGLDAAEPAFWSKGLTVIEGLIDELEALEE